MINKMKKELKKVCKIRDEYFDNNLKISAESLQMLEQHLKGDDRDELLPAFSLVTDARLMKLVPMMASYLNDNDWMFRFFAISNLLGRLQLPEYAEKGLEMCNTDANFGVRETALSSLGAIIDLIKDKQLQKQIAEKILAVLQDKQEHKSMRKAAYESVLQGLKYPFNEACLIQEKAKDDLVLYEAKIEEFKHMYYNPPEKKKLKRKEMRKREY